jgi:hypothetical protein
MEADFYMADALFVLSRETFSENAGFILTEWPKTITIFLIGCRAFRFFSPAHAVIR